MIFPGLASVTFRALSPAAVIDVAVGAGLQGIEWGADVHVPPGDLVRAREVAKRTIDAGLRVASYGSYYRAGQGTSNQVDFEAVLETAVGLGAPTIRVWAGPAEFLAVVEDLLRIGELAAPAGVEIGTEFHEGTLTETAASAATLIDAVAHPVRTYWQPPHDQTDDERRVGLTLLGHRVSNLHVFHWTRGEDGQIRRPLAEGRGWSRFLETAGRLPGDRWALLEFVAGDDPGHLRADATVLKSLLTRGTAPRS